MLRTLIWYDAQGGHIWAAIGRVTFSAAETLASRIDQWTGATFVGEPTGSRPNHFGNEAQGLGDVYVSACQRRVTIPMQHGTDSLNVAVAAAVFLYHFTKETGGDQPVTSR